LTRCYLDVTAILTEIPDELEGFVGGQLLLRATRGIGGVEDRGVGNVEPDEDLHVPRMSMVDITSDPAGPALEAAEVAEFGRCC